MKIKKIALISIALTVTFAASFFFIKNSKSSETTWVKECAKLPNSETEICEISQSIIDKKSKRKIAKLAVGKLPDDTLKSVLVVPLGVFISKGVEFYIDKEPMGNLDIQYCMLDGCYALINNEKTNFIEKAKGGNKAQAQIVSINGKKMEIEFTFDGFTKAYNKID